MTANEIKSPRPLSDALYAFALATSAPNAELLDEFVRRYPEHALALTDFAIEWALDTAVGSCRDTMEPAPTLTSPVVARAMSRFHNRLHAVRQAVRASSEAITLVENPFSRLNRDTVRGLGKRLGVNTVFVMKLRDRQIKPDTIPDGFRHRIATEMAVPIAIIDAHLSTRPQIQLRSHYKADQKPQIIAQQSFEDAVRSSGLSPDQQRLLLSA